MNSKSAKCFQLSTLVTLKTGSPRVHDIVLIRTFYGINRKIRSASVSQDQQKKKKL
jgi:hypothetical protein